MELNHISKQIRDLNDKTLNPFFKLVEELKSENEEYRRLFNTLDEDYRKCFSLMKSLKVNVGTPENPRTLSSMIFDAIEKFRKIADENEILKKIVDKHDL